MNIKPRFSSCTRLCGFITLLCLAACSTSTTGPNGDQVEEDAVAAAAQQIAQQYLIVDTHIDVPYRVFRNPADVSEATEDGQFDHPRAKAGGLNAAFMSIYIPAAVDEAGDAFTFAEQSISSVRNLATAHPEKFAIATCADDVLTQSQAGLVSLPMGMENGGPIDHKVKNLEHFYQRGIRYITLTHSKSNHISDSSYDSNERWQGLSEFGKQLVPQMNRVGMMIDVSHISDLAFWQVMSLSRTPVIASHSSLRHFTPGFQRNMTDKMVQALAAAGGVVQINFGSSFLTEAARDYSEARTAAVKAYQLSQHLADGDPALLAKMQAYSKLHPYPFADIDDVLDHIDRVVQLAGIEAVGIGSDYDGVGDSLPVDLKDVSSYPNLVAGLLARGYSEADIAKILGENMLRVWRQVEGYAADQGSQTLCTGA